MKELGFTKGEWKVGTESYTGDLFIEDGCCKSIALVSKQHAHLVAAAPAMYEALKAIIDAKALHKTDPLREQIIKALAQAEGKP